METFKGPLNYINEHIVTEGFEEVKKNGSIYSSNKTEILKFKSGDEIYVGKEYFDNDFLKVAKEFLLENNMKNFFTIGPVKIFKIGEGQSAKFCIIMEKYLPFDKFFSFFEKNLDEDQNEEIQKDINLNILITFVSLFVAINSLHVQNNPILHHDLKPLNILIIPYRLANGELQRVKVPHKGKYKHEPGTIYIARLIDFDLMKENIDQTNSGYTPGYRTKEHYTEFSDIFSLAVILEMFIYRKTSFLEFRKVKHENLILKMDEEYNGYVSEFYFEDKSKIKGLEKIVDMLLESVQNKDYNLPQIINILTTPDQLTKILPPDFIDEKRLDIYFEILKIAKIRSDLNPEYKKIAPQIFGPNYDNFLFAMFHQKGNDLDLQMYQNYQKNIVKKWKQNLSHEEKIDEISKLHYDMNFFDLKKQIDEFNTKYQIDATSKLFKILVSLDFKNTRSLHNFVNALSYSTSYISNEMKYRLKLLFGKNYKAKVGFILLNSKNTKLKTLNTLLLETLNITEFFSKFNFSDFGLDDDIDISLSDLNLSDFNEFLNKINYKPEEKNYSKKCKDMFLSMIHNNEKQNKLHEFFEDDYKESSPIIILAFYLVFYEIKCEEAQKNKKNVDFDISTTQYTTETTSNQTVDKYIFTIPRDKSDIIRINWFILYKLYEIKESVLSQELLEKFQKYFPVINFLKSLNICLYDFHQFLSPLYSKGRIDVFMQIIQNFDVDSTTSKLQFLESISLLSVDFLECIFRQMKKTNNELLKYISIDEFDKKLVVKENFDISTKINSTFIFCSYGKIKYKEDCYLFNLKDKYDETKRSKIALCLTHAFTYLKKLPFILHTKLFKNIILIDEKTVFPMIQLKIDDNDDQEESEVNYCTIIQKLMKEKDNIYLNIIRNIFIEEYNSYLPIQHIFNFFLSKTINFTFNDTNMNEFNKFVDQTIKNSFYDEKFAYFATDLLGQSYVFVLDYLFKTNKAIKAKNDFVNEMNEITKNIKSYKLIEDADTLSKISALFIKYYDEDLFSFIHLLNQFIIPQDKYNTKQIVSFSEKYGKYQYQNKLKDEAISNIYHMLNKFISPLSHVDENELCFIVPKKKYNQELFGKKLNKYHFYFSLKSALYYLCNYQDQNLLLKEKLSIDNIYINEMGEAIVLPFVVDEKIMNDIIVQIKNELNIKEESDISQINHSYANYIPLKDEHIKKLMMIFGFDYITELNDIINSYPLLIFDESLINNFHDKLENLVITDEYILELAKRCNKLWPMFTHLLEKATYSNDNKIKNEAKKLLNIYRSIKEIDRNGIEIIGDLIGKLTGEAAIYLCTYKNETIVFKGIRADLNPYVYLEKIINMLFILKSFEEEIVNKYVIKEIGFTNFGPLMNYYSTGNLKQYLDKSDNKNGLFWLKFIYRMADGIYLLHKNKIVHNDITPTNILISNNSLPLLSDMINIHHESSFIQSRVQTDNYTPKIYKKRMEKDVYGFEVIVFEIKKKIFKKDKIDCPLINEIKKNIKKYDDESNQDYTERSIEYYIKLMKNDMMYLLPINSSEKDKKDMDRKFKNFVNEIDTDQNKSFINLLNQEINDDNFFEVVDNLKDLISDNNININYIKELASFAEKISKINLDKNEEHFTYILNLIDEKIKDDINKNKNIYFNQNNNNINYSCYEIIGNLIFQRFYLYKFNGIDDIEFLKEMIFCLNRSFKARKIDEILFSKINFIIDILEENESRYVGYFYQTIIHGKSNCEHLEGNIVFLLKAIILNYSNAIEDKIKIDIRNFEVLIMKVFDILLKYDDKKAEFLSFIQTNDPKKEIIKDHVISLFYHTYRHNPKKYKDLNSMFSQIEEYAANSIIPKYKDLPSNNEYMKSLINSVNFKGNDGRKLTAIYKDNY